MVCADAESLSGRDLIRMARYVHDKQRAQVVEAMRRVLVRDRRRTLPVIAAGLGSFLVRDAARFLGWPVQDIAEVDGKMATPHIPPIGAAYLLAEWLEKRNG
jgi:uncharacterized hydantoinase/oxoprolinase family protein